MAKDRGRPPAVVESSSITLEQIDGLREGVFEVVAANVVRAQQVLEGRHAWSGTQAKLFLHMLDKVMPSLNHTHRTSSVVVKPADEWTNEELAAFLASSSAPRPSVIDRSADTPAPIPTAPVDDAVFVEAEASARDEIQ